MSPARGRSVQRGQSLMEFAITLPLLLLLLGAAIDFGLLFGNRLAMSNAARVGVRWASKYPTNWSASSTPDSTTIEGQIQIAGGTSNIPNDDSHIQINYYDVNLGTGTLTFCGKYSVAGAGFQAAAGYSQASCVTRGHVIEIIVTYSYPALTPTIQGLFGATIPVTVGASMLEEV